MEFWNKKPFIMQNAGNFNHFILRDLRHPQDMLLCPPHWVVITLRFRSFQGKVFILSLPNLVWVFIGLIACMGLVLVKIAV